jgi:hypothetical protein
MFNVRRFVSLGLAALMLILGCGILFTSTGVASAHAAVSAVALTANVSCYNTSCDGKSPVSTGCSSGAITLETSTSGDLGGGLKVTINLRFSDACGSAWAQEVFNKAVPSNVRGYADLWRPSTSSDVNCNNSGGDGDVLPGQTSCYSPMLGDYGSTKSEAFGYVSFDNGYGWNAPVQTVAA